MYSLTQITTVGITILLLGLALTAGISLHQIQSFSLPIPRTTAVATFILPFLNGIGLIGGRSYAVRSGRSSRKQVAFLSWPTITAFVFLTVYETVISTLAMTHMVPPDDLTCGLSRQWGRLYSRKDAGAIKRIQDAHQCCGLMTIKDKAWPFSDDKHKSDACATAFNRTKSCMGDWRRDEQVFAGLLLFVALTTLVLKLLFIVRFISQKPKSWFHRVVQRTYPALTAGDNEEQEAGTINEQEHSISRRIEAAYRDSPVEDVDAEDLASQANETSADQSENTQRNYGPTVQPSRLLDEHNEWAR